MQFSDNDPLWTYGAPLGAAGVILVTGAWTEIRRYRATIRKLDFANEFRNEFISYCNSQGDDTKAYTWLTLNSARMQSEMGALGVYEAFKPPAASYMVKNYQIITNMLPELRRYIDENRQSLGLFANTIDGYMKTIDEALLRYIGVLQHRETDEKAKLINPLVWLRSGMEQLLSMPLLLFVWFGVVGSSAVYRLQSSIIFKLVSVSTVLLGLVSGVMTVSLGWEEFSKMVVGLFSWA